MKRNLLVVLVLVAVGATSSLFAQEKVLAIDECVQIALEQNPEIVMGEFTVKMANRDVVIAMSNFLPTVSVSTGYYHSVVGPSSMMRVDPGTGILVPLQPDEIVSWASTARANVNQTLFSGGYNTLNFLASKALKKSSEQSFEVTRQTTILLVKERYYNLLMGEKLLNVAEETLKSSEESFKRAEVLFQVGKVPKSDVLKAKVQLETDRLSLIQAQNSLAIAKASLNHVLGFDVDQIIKVVDNLDVSEMDVGYDDVLTNAMANHPSLKKSMYDLSAAKAGVGMALSSYLPTVSGYYQYSWSHPEFSEMNNMLDTDFNWYMGVTLSVSLFEGFSRIASTSKALLEKKSSIELYEQTKRDVALEAKTSFFEVQQAQKSIVVSKDAVEAADEDLRLNKEKYALGAGTMLELINAQVSSASAQSDHIQALYNYKYAIARLQMAMGNLNK